MAEASHPLEGKIVVLQFTEQDNSGEESALVVYRVTGGELENIWGVSNLPDQVEDWDDEEGRAIIVILALGVTEVYTPIYTPVFLGINLGVCQESAISHIDERGEMENWFRFDTLSFPEQLAQELESYHIKLRYFDSETGEIFGE
jgi:hypothetical protein